MAVLCEADEFEVIADFGQQNQAVLGRHLAWLHGVPSPDIFRRIFQHLNAPALNTAFLGWVRTLLSASVAAQVCVDRQTLRESGPQALPVVSDLVRSEGLCLAQVATAGKGRELAAIPAVLALLNLSGRHNTPVRWQVAVRYYLSSQPGLTTAQALTVVRGHRAVENQLHWHLDVTLRQDAHLLRDQRPAGSRKPRPGAQNGPESASSRRERRQSKTQALRMER